MGPFIIHKIQSTPISQLRNLGPSSAKILAKINVKTLQDLKNKSPIQCFAELRRLNNQPLSLNLLYAMLGAIENKHWTEYKKMKGELLIQLEGISELDNLFNKK
ncbi:TfoX/Sxy family DNA transformation protein [Aliikangiella sp. IMCC44359]|uniref:TfoX/Sxy family DNA transformation protein n=1 Tax=Aliikangiella sp. IMCC44359 TaxID=3459125 RepID=UPI00403A8313